MSNHLYHCLANGVFGRFGDYIWAASRAAAENQFYLLHGVFPSATNLIRRAAK